MKVKVIYADPAWRFDVWCRDTGLGRSADSHYKTMTLDQIKSLNVRDIANPEGCALFLWATLPMLPEALEVMKAWGFEYKTVGFVWVKLNKNWKQWIHDINRIFFFGMGYWTRANVEVCLLGTRGKVKRVDAGVRQLVVSPIREHSRKPDEVRERIVKLIGDVPRLEMFCRYPADGWLVWGNEVQSDVVIQ